MRKATNKESGIKIEIPGLGNRNIKTVVSDYTGTHSFNGKVRAQVKARLRQLARQLELHIITADSFGTAARELKGIAKPYLLKSDKHDVEKEEYVARFDLKHVAAFGNGNNDRRMLKAVREGGGLAIAVDNGEGCAIDAVLNAHLFIVGALNALDLLLNPTRCKATLRF
jgi:soluble P-type ATPase